MGDVDGDNDLDAFVSNWGPIMVWLNDGNGNFTDSGQTFGTFSHSWGGQALGDLDGDFDTFEANVDNEANIVWLNDINLNGRLVFTNASVGSTN